jgi:hypothetical protein
LGVTLVLFALAGARVEGVGRVGDFDLVFVGLGAVLGACLWVLAGVGRSPDEGRGLGWLRVAARGAAPAAFVTAVAWHVGYAHVPQADGAGVRRWAVVPGVLVAPGVAACLFALAEAARGRGLIGFEWRLRIAAAGWTLSGFVVVAYALLGLKGVGPTDPLTEATGFVIGMSALAGGVGYLYTIVLMGRGLTGELRESAGNDQAP